MCCHVRRGKRNNKWFQQIFPEFAAPMEQERADMEHDDDDDDNGSDGGDTVVDQEESEQEEADSFEYNYDPETGMAYREKPGVKKSML